MGKVEGIISNRYKGICGIICLWYIYQGPSLFRQKANRNPSLIRHVFAWDPDVYYISEALATCGVSELIRSAQGFLPSSNSNNTSAKSNYRGGRLGNEATREQNKEIATFLEEEGYTIVGGGGRTKEEYLPAIDGGRKGSNYVDITAQKGDDIIRINTVDVYANGTITAREQNAANMINQKTGGNIILIPKGSGLGKLPEILHSDN